MYYERLVNLGSVYQFSLNKALRDNAGPRTMANVILKRILYSLLFTTLFVANLSNPKNIISDS